MRAKSLLDPFSEGDPIIVTTDWVRLELKGKEGIITEYLGGGYYKVFIPDWPPCFVDGEEGLEWRLFYRDMKKAGCYYV